MIRENGNAKVLLFNTFSCVLELCAADLMPFMGTISLSANSSDMSYMNRLILIFGFKMLMLEEEVNFKALLVIYSFLFD